MKSQKNKEILRGAEIFCRALKDEGVKHLFGYPGGAVLHIYDALYKQNDVEHILVRHEQGATHAADGYARATGKPGVVVVLQGRVQQMLLLVLQQRIWTPYRLLFLQGKCLEK